MNRFKQQQICPCESLPDQKPRIDCYMNSYTEFLRKRHIVFTNLTFGGGVDGSGSGGGGYSPKLFEAYKRGRINRIEDIVHDPIVCSSTTAVLAESLILQSFLKRYCERHPFFAACVKSSNFKTKIGLWSMI